MLLKPIVEANLNPIVTLKMSPYGAHYDTAVKIFNDNKLFGIGLKNFRIESGNPKYKNKEFICNQLNNHSFFKKLNLKNKDLENMCVKKKNINDFPKEK